MLFYKATFYCFLYNDLKDEKPGKTTSAKYRSQLVSYLENKDSGRGSRRFCETMRNAATPWSSFCFLTDCEDGPHDFTLAFAVEKHEEAFHLIAALKNKLLNSTDEADVQLQEITLQDLVKLKDVSDRICYNREFAGPLWDFIRLHWGFHSTFHPQRNFKETIPEIKDYNCKKIHL